METRSTMSLQMNRLICPLCCDRFKTPKMLLCGHTFCQLCVQQLFQSTPVSCPVCRVKVSTQHNSVDQLPTNYVLKALVDSDTDLFDKESFCRSFGQCPTHDDVCDQFCQTCVKQMCKQCISEHHQGSPHHTSPVGAVVVQRREVLNELVIALTHVMKRLQLMESNITESEKTCQSEADQLSEDINASVAKCTDNIAAHGESLQIVVQEDKGKILKYLDDLKLKHSEVSLSASYALDQCRSLQLDLDKNNLSRVAVLKRLIENRRKIKKDLEKLEGKKNVLHIGLKFQSLTKEAKAGKLESKTSLIPIAMPMEAISFENGESKTDRNLSDRNESQHNPSPFAVQKKSIPAQSFAFGTVQPSRYLPEASSQAKASVLGFLWPSPNWMIAVKMQKAGAHSFVKFTNLHFLRETFHHEIGVDQEWTYVSNCDCKANFILCLCPGKVHKFSLPSIQNLKEPGKIVRTVFTPDDFLGIAWDKEHIGCYALLNDGKTLLHVDFEGPDGCKEVAVFDEEITSCGDTQFLHVNEEGSMAICDHQKEVVYFFEEIEAEPTLTVRAPSDLQNATPICISTRRGEKLWYVLWRFKSGSDYVVKLYVYDSSFQVIDSVPNLRITVTSVNSRVMFCFQGDYVAVTMDDDVEVYALC